ncbi:MAG: sensor histidine kinase [Bacteroidota bacterium]
MKSSTAQHSAFWVLSFCFIGSYFSISNTLKAIDFVYALFFHISLVPLVYINLKVLIPKFLNSKQYVIYFAGAVLNIGLAIAIHELAFELLIPALPLDYYIVSFTDTILLGMMYGIYTLLTALLKLSRSWFRIKELEKENTELALSTLRFQINPHFLLNSLNSIYALALQKSEATPEVILKLSGMLKHILYGETGNKISLQQEVNYLTHYVELQKLRFEENADIRFKSTGDFKNHEIAPLILITFFENSFKHGVSGKVAGAYAHFDLNLSGNGLSLRAVNSKGKTNNAPGEGGIGLENVKKRLQLLYKDRHSLEIEENKTMFKIYLTLDL